MFARPVRGPQRRSAGFVYRSNTRSVLARCSAFLVFEVLGVFAEADLGLRPYCILIIYYKAKQIKSSTLYKKTPQVFVFSLFLNELCSCKLGMYFISYGHTSLERSEVNA